MAISSKALANHLLDLAKCDATDVSPMKLQKLVYFCQGWHLAITDEPLINEQIEAWKYGPVVDSLFHAFKSYGRSPIDSPAVRYIVKTPENIESGNLADFEVEGVIPSIDDECEDQAWAEVAKRIVKKVWDVYKPFSAERLSNMSHVPGGPWAETVAKYEGAPPKGTDISRDLLASHFSKALKSHLAK